MSDWWVWILVPAAISLKVIVHESGHYFVARAFGMRVLSYSIGVGPAIFKWQPKGSPTVFQICAIPLLAYVQVDGMNPTEEIDSPKKEKKLPVSITYEQVLQLFHQPDMTLYIGYRDRVIMELLYSSGLRLSELVGLNRGDIDAYLAGDTDLGQIEVQGFPVRQIPFKAPPALEGTGAFYLGAREDYLKVNPQVAVGIGRAVAKGTVFALNNLEAATRIFFKLYPEALPKGKAADVASQDIVKLVGARAKNWVRPNQPPKRWGQVLGRDWEADVKFLGLEGKVPNVERFITNEFIEKINDFDGAKIAEQARTYKLR